MSGVRAEWLTPIDRGVEQLTDDLAATDMRSARPLIEQFVDRIEPPPDAMHGAVLSSILMDLCSRVVRAMHDQNPPATCTCEGAVWSHIGRFEQWRGDDPRPAFQDWLRMFYTDYERQHPRDAALAAAEAIRREPTRTWTLDALASLAGTRPLQLRREFEIRFGMRPAGYVQLIRVTRAVALLRTPVKVEAIAWDVGYKSKKDLYAALSRWTDSTPTALRALSAPESAWLERQLLAQCFGGVPSTNDGSLRLIARDTRAGAAPATSNRRGSRQPAPRRR